MKYYIPLTIVLAIFAFVAISYDRSDTAYSASAGSSYYPVQITSANASATAGYVVRGGWGELGHITINSATATAAITIYDGATTATSGLTVLGVINASAPNGTYTYEATVNKGVVLGIPAAFTGNITVSSR